MTLLLGRRGGERVVPLVSWARRYGWDVPRAEQVLWVGKLFSLNSVSEGHVLFISSKSRVYLPKDGDLVGLSARRSVGFS